MPKQIKRIWTDMEESGRIALEQLRAHKFRSLLTALGVIIGVWAVIVIGIGMNGIDTGFRRSLDMIGQDHFYVDKFPWRDVGDDWRMYRNRPDIETSYTEQLNDIFSATPNSTIQIAVPTLGTNRNISRDALEAQRVAILGTNADFGYISTAQVERGRFFTAQENASAQNVVILGSAVLNALFPDQQETAIGSRVKIGGIQFTVIGVLEEQGSFLGVQSFDNQAIVPLPTAQKYFVGFRHWNNTSLRIVKKPEADREDARYEIIGAMRRVRGLVAGEDDDFEVNSSDAIENTLGPVKTRIAIGGFFITGLALFVGAIGIMNITFVSVKERTKEIGTRRAIGARRRSILIQFLFEAVSICLLGGLVGVVFAAFSKMALAKIAPQFPASFSYDLMFVAFALSVMTGVLSGFVPALKASRLDPATALRHE